MKLCANGEQEEMYGLPWNSLIVFLEEKKLKCLKLALKLFVLCIHILDCQTKQVWTTEAFVFSFKIQAKPVHPDLIIYILVLMQN